jgi:hypothetical protein
MYLLIGAIESSKQAVKSQPLSLDSPGFMRSKKGQERETNPLFSGRIGF